MNRTILLLLNMFLILLGAHAQEYNSVSSDNIYKEQYRNQYHFSQRQGWISDPCGYLYYEGKFHCYWWGWAESENLVYFTEYNHNGLELFSHNEGIAYSLDVWPMKSVW